MVVLDTGLAPGGRIACREGFFGSLLDNIDNIRLTVQLVLQVFLFRLQPEVPVIARRTARLHPSLECGISNWLSQRVGLHAACPLALLKHPAEA